MIISKIRIDRDIQAIEHEVKKNMQEAVNVLVREYRAKLQEQVNGKNLSDFPYQVCAHIPRRENSMRRDLIEVEKWLEEHCSGDVLVQYAPSSVYGWSDDDEDIACEEVDDEYLDYTKAEKVDLNQLVHDAGNTGTNDRPNKVVGYPAYVFRFTDPDDAVKFKMFWADL